jgi:hypothetical protein
MSRAKSDRCQSRLQTCGDNGGLSLNGTACNHAAGFGTPHPGEGRCRKHDKVSDAIVQALKKTFTQRLEETSFRQACKAVDRNPTTIWRWRKADHEFDIAMTQARRMRDELDVAEVEQTLVRRCIAGTATSAETIFFLVNRSAGRWRHVQRIEHAGDPDRPVQVHHELDQLTLSEKIELLRGIVARHTGPNRV